MWVELDSRGARESPAPNFSLDFGGFRGPLLRCYKAGVSVSCSPPQAVLPYQQGSDCRCRTSRRGSSPAILRERIIRQKMFPPLQNQPVY